MSQTTKSDRPPGTAGSHAAEQAGLHVRRGDAEPRAGRAGEAKSETDLWGQDIALDSAGQAMVAANGELVLTTGADTGVQDIRLRLFTRLGSLFYDKNFGSLIHDWILEDSTEESRAALCAEAVMRVEADPRVAPYSVTAAILKWDDRKLEVAVFWRFLGEDQPLNLVLQLNKSTKELVVKDADPTDYALQTGI